MSRVAEAAAQMRARAEAVGEGPWESYALPDAGPNRWTMTGVGVVDDDMGHRIEAMFPADAEHIASLHPAVALVIADALRDIDAAIGWGDWMSVEAAIRKVADVYLDGAS